MYIKSRKLIIIPTRKCGGISVSEALKEYMTDIEYKLYNLGTRSGHLGKDIVSNEEVFGIWENNTGVENDIYLIVRNPYDKMVSNYFYSDKGKKIWNETLTFNDFVKYVQTKEQPFNWTNHTKTLSTDFVKLDNEIIPHKLIRFETLTDDFNELVLHYDLNASLPFLNKSRNDTGKYREYYNVETKQIVKELFKEDLDYFGYEF